MAILRIKGTGGADQAVSFDNPFPTASIGGTATSRIASAAATNNATVVKAAAGRVYRASLYNAAATPRYLKFYNKATAPNPAADTPVWTEYLPATSKTVIDFQGLVFSAGISLALVTGAGDTDNTSLTLADILALNVSYS